MLKGDPMRIQNKKAQSGMNAAVLVAVILGLIILYIIYLPTSEVEKLLYNESKSHSDSEDEEGENVLLLEYPKRLDNVEDIDNKELPNVYLLRSTEAKEIERLNPFSVRNGVFDKKDKTLSFSLDNIENTDNILLSFNAAKHKGTLIISLNDEIIYEKDIESSTAEPVSLKKSLLEDDNTISFSVSSVGFAFWTTNEYQLEDVKIIGDITDVSRQKSQNIFTLTQTEYNNLDKATLRFIPYCSSNTDVGVLEVSVNNEDVFAAVPVCEDPYRQVIPTQILNAGDNYVVFKTSKGSYSVEQIELDFEVKDTKEKVYYFEINDTNWEKIEDDGDDVMLEIEFVDNDDLKRADLNINGHLTNIDQEDRDYSKNINRWVEEGNNYIEIVPDTELEIKELRIEIKD